MGTPGKDEKAIWQSYHVLNASRSEKIFQVDPDLACQPTPATFVETLEAMEAALK
jgi:iron complex transport system substrate-binding protein